MNSRGDAPSRRAAVLTWGLVVLALGYALLVHHGVGPPLRTNPAPWWSPRGFLIEALAGSPLAALLVRPRLATAVGLLPAAALCVAVFATSRSTPARGLALAAALATALFLYYGLRPVRVVWRFFQWRASLAMLSVCGVVATAVLVPWIVRAWQRRRAAVWLAGYALACGAILALERNVTGTDPALLLAVSPWPVVPVFGLDVAASALAVTFAGIALGLFGLRALRGGARRRRRALGLAGLVLGTAFPAIAVWLGGRTALLPFAPDPGTIVTAGGLSLAGVAVAAWGRPPGALARRARLLGASALLMGIPLLAGQLLVRQDYVVTRDARAGRIIDALARYYERHEVYPDTLEELVEAGELGAIPRPRIGFAWLGPARFTYQSFGTSYLLEFAAPRWMQCAYNPPFTEEEADGETLGEAWSCPSRPPELW